MVFWGQYSPLRTACLFSYGNNKYFLSFNYYLINIVNIKILNSESEFLILNCIVPL